MMSMSMRLGMIKDMGMIVMLMFDMSVCILHF